MASDFGKGTLITLIYGSSQLLLLIILAVVLYRNSETVKSLSFRKFCHAIWKERGVFSPALIYVYDTATDIGVLYEWHKLAQIEKTGENLESLDLDQFFWIGISIIIVYRIVLAVIGCVYVWNKRKQDDSVPHTLCVMCSAVVLGFLEWTIFASIWIDSKEKQTQKSDKRGAGLNQKTTQLIEGILESLPEVVLQSVFLMRAINDDNLKDVLGDVKALLVVSIIVSLLNITNKYIWIDEYMVKENAKSICIKHVPQDKINEHLPQCGEHKTKLVLVYGASRRTISTEDTDFQLVMNSFRPCDICGINIPEKTTYYHCSQSESEQAGCAFYVCNLCYEREEKDINGVSWPLPYIDKNKWRISYGYIIRAVWRLCAVSSRFIIFALIWVVMGGYFEVILVPIMVVLWYILLFIYFAIEENLFKCKDLCKKEQWDEMNSCCEMFNLKTMCVHSGVLFGKALVISIGFLSVGLVFQMGILGLTGLTIYVIRMVENAILMTTITVFAFAQFDCGICASSEHRNALGNNWILFYIILGWLALAVHVTMSLFIHSLVDFRYAQQFSINVVIRQWWWGAGEQLAKNDKKRQNDRQLKMKSKSMSMCIGGTSSATNNSIANSERTENTDVEEGYTNNESDNFNLDPSSPVSEEQPVLIKNYVSVWNEPAPQDATNQEAIWSKSTNKIERDGWDYIKMEVTWNIVDREGHGHHVQLRHTQDCKTDITEKILYLDGVAVVNEMTNENEFAVNIYSVYDDNVEIDQIDVEIKPNQDLSEYEYLLKLNDEEYSLIGKTTKI